MCPSPCATHCLYRQHSTSNNLIQYSLFHPSGPSEIHSSHRCQSRVGRWVGRGPGRLCPVRPRPLQARLRCHRPPLPVHAPVTPSRHHSTPVRRVGGAGGTCEMGCAARTHTGTARGRTRSRARPSSGPRPTASAPASASARRPLMYTPASCMPELAGLAAASPPQLSLPNQPRVFERIIRSTL